MFDMTDHEALLIMDYRTKRYQQAAITRSDLHLASPCGGRGCVFSRSLSRDGCHLLARLASALSRRAASLSPCHSPSHTDYTQHILILSFSHMSHVRLCMSQCKYSPGWGWSENWEHLPKTKTDKEGGKTTKEQEARQNTSPVNTTYALGRTFGFLCAPEQVLHYCYPEGRLVPLPCTESHTATRPCRKPRTLKGPGCCYISTDTTTWLFIFSYSCQDSEAKMVREFWFLTLKLSPEEFPT